MSQTNIRRLSPLEQSELRDRFACAVLAALIADPRRYSIEIIAKYSWEIADEMLKARGEVK